MAVRAYLPRVAPFGVAVHPGFISGGVYRLAGTHGTSVAVPAADLLYLWAWIPPAAVTAAQLGVIASSGGTTSNMKIGIWANNPTTMRPTSTPLAYNNSGIATTGTGLLSGAVNAYPLAPGVMVWIGSVHTGAVLPTVNVVSPSTTNFQMLCGVNYTATNAANQVVGFSAPQTYSNNIATADMTSATFTNVAGNGMPNYVLTA